MFNRKETYKQANKSRHNILLNIMTKDNMKCFFGITSVKVWCVDKGSFCISNKTYKNVGDKVHDKCNNIACHRHRVWPKPFYLRGK